MNNEQGVLGETIFNIAVSRGYLFRPRALGEKWPVSDFYVELVDFSQHYHFFVQVKSTTRGLDREGNLTITADKEKVNRLSQYHAPTYIAGVDILTEEVFLMTINAPLENNLTKMPTTFKLADSNLEVLFDEVKDFWNRSGIRKYKTTFNFQV